MHALKGGEYCDLGGQHVQKFWMRRVIGAEFLRGGNAPGLLT